MATPGGFQSSLITVVLLPLPLCSVALHAKQSLLGCQRSGFFFPSLVPVLGVAFAVAITPLVALLRFNIPAATHKPPVLLPVILITVSSSSATAAAAASPQADVLRETGKPPTQSR